MLPHQHRLSDFSAFQNVVRRGRKVHTPHFRVAILSNNPTTTAVGFVVSKKVARKATERNRLKRKMREAVRREILPQLSSTAQIVIIALPGAPKLNYNDIVIELRNSLLSVEK